MPMKPFQILCACSLLLCAATSLWAQDPFPPVITSDSEHTLTEPLADDATLHDVRFVDAEFGWAVGDHGVVLHTSDGGQHWHRQRREGRREVGSHRHRREAALALEPAEHQPGEIPAKGRRRVEHRAGFRHRAVIEHHRRPGARVAREVLAHDDDRDAGRRAAEHRLPGPVVSGW